MQDFDECEEGEISDDPTSEIVCYTGIMIVEDDFCNVCFDYIDSTLCSTGKTCRKLCVESIQTTTNTTF